MDAAFIWNLSKLGRIGSRRLQFDDDLADRLNYQYTGVLLFMFIGLIGVRQYVGKPIQCWIPQEFTRGWEEYAENYCWVANTYFAPLHNRIPPKADRSQTLIVYYQWAPIVMAAQALLFYLPCLTWRLCMSHSGYNLHRILQLAAETNEMMPDATAKTVNILAHYIRACVNRHKTTSANATDSKLSTATADKAKSKTNKGVKEDAKSNGHNHHKEDVGTTHSNDDAVGDDKKKNSTSNVPTITDIGQESLDNRLNHHQHRHHHQRQVLVNDQRLNGSPLGLSSHRPLQRGDGGGGERQSLSEVELNQLGAVNRGLDGANFNTVERMRQRKPPPPPLPPPTSKNQSKDFNVLGTNKQPKPCSMDKSINDFKLNRVVDVNLIDSYSNQKIKPIAKVVTHQDHQPSTSGLGRRHGNYLALLYLLVKLGYTLNIVGQLCLMQSFIGTSYTLYGAYVLADLIRGRDWHKSGHFPRVTFCDLEAKKMGKNHMYSLQCVLPLNMFLEKIYVFLWFWHVALGVITLTSLFVWLHRLFARNGRNNYIANYLQVLDQTVPSRSQLESFITSYLSVDGLFVIKMISSNCGGILAGDLVTQLWHSYLQSLGVDSSPKQPPPGYLEINDKLQVEASKKPIDNGSHELATDTSLTFDPLTRWSMINRRLGDLRLLEARIRDQLINEVIFLDHSSSRNHSLTQNGLLTSRLEPVKRPGSASDSFSDDVV